MKGEHEVVSSVDPPSVAMKNEEVIVELNNARKSSNQCSSFGDGPREEGETETITSAHGNGSNKSLGQQGVHLAEVGKTHEVRPASASTADANGHAKPQTFHVEMEGKDLDLEALAGKPDPARDKDELYTARLSPHLAKMREVGARPEWAAGKVGMCFSGGGIRSASFCSGVLCHAVQTGAINRIDYLSSVSGGGFVASSFVDWSLEHPGQDPKEWIADYFSHMEQNAGYLVSFNKGAIGGMFDIAALFAIVLIFILIVFVSIFPYTFIVAEFYSVLWVWNPNPEFPYGGYGSPRTRYMWLIWVGIFWGLNILRRAISGSKSDMMRHIQTAIIMPLEFLTLIGAFIETFLMFFMMTQTVQFAIDQLISVVSVDNQQDLINVENTFAMSLQTFIAIITVLVATFSEDDYRFRNVGIWGIGCLFAVMATIRVLQYPIFGLPFVESTWNWIAFGGIMVIFLEPLIDRAKQKFFHGFFRWRLQRAFYFRKGFFGHGGNRIQQAAQVKPQWICTTSIQMCEALDCYDDLSSFDVFAITPTHCERINRPLPPEITEFENLTLADAMATSAAAFSFAMGNYAVPPIRPLLIIFGMGLGKWVRIGKQGKLGRLGVIYGINAIIFFPIIIAILTSIQYLFPIVLAMAVAVSLIVPRLPKRWGLDLNQLSMVQSFRQIWNVPYRVGKDPKLIFLTDGAHSENLGFLPLLRNRCTRIVVIDASADNANTCEELMVAVHLARQKLRCSFSTNHPIKEIQDGDFEVIFKRAFAGKRYRQNLKKFYFNFYVRYDDDTVGFCTYMKPRRIPPIITMPSPFGETVSGDCDSEPAPDDVSTKKPAPMARPGAVGWGAALDAHFDHMHDIKKFDADHLHGCCCVCCNTWDQCDPVIGQYPNQSTAVQFFTPDHFRALHQQGFAAAQAADVWACLDLR